MSFSLGARSLSFATHVDPTLIRVVQHALSISTQDAGFTAEQSRTLAEEQALVAAGRSHTLKSHHIIGCPGAAPGYSGAVDLVPWLDSGKAFSWQWALIYPLAVAMRQASIELSVPITWGGAWDRILSEIDVPADGDPADALRAASDAYVGRERAKGVRSPLIDGPHYELGRN